MTGLGGAFTGRAPVRGSVAEEGRAGVSGGALTGGAGATGSGAALTLGGACTARGSAGPESQVLVGSRAEGGCLKTAAAAGAGGLNGIPRGTAAGGPDAQTWEEEGPGDEGLEEILLVFRSMALEAHEALQIRVHRFEAKGATDVDGDDDWTTTE